MSEKLRYDKEDINLCLVNLNHNPRLALLNFILKWKLSQSDLITQSKIIELKKYKSIHWLMGSTVAEFADVKLVNHCEWFAR